MLGHLVPSVLLPALHGSGAASAATFALDLIWADLGPFGRDVAQSLAAITAGRPAYRGSPGFLASTVLSDRERWNKKTPLEISNLMVNPLDIETFEGRRFLL